MRCDAASSSADPSTARRRTGPFSPNGASVSASPDDPASADPAKTYGSSGHASCHDGTDVSASSTAVYVATPGATSADATPAGRLNVCTRPRSGGGTTAGSPAAAASPTGRENPRRNQVAPLLRDRRFPAR